MNPQPIIIIPIAILYQEEASFPFNLIFIQKAPTPTASDMIKKDIHALALKTIPTSDWKKE